MIDKRAIEFADLFVTSLSNPYRPDHCALFYLSCLKIFTSTPETIISLQRTRHDIFDTLIRFLTVPRSRSEALSFGTSLEKCTCAVETDSDIKLIHNLRDFRYPKSPCTFVDVLDSIMELVVRAIVRPDPNNAIPQLRKARKEAHKAERSGLQPQWPTKASDTFPQGGETTIRMLWTWVDLYGIVHVVSYVNILLRSSGSTFISFFSKMPNYPSRILAIFESRLDKLNSSKYQEVHPFDLASIHDFIRLTGTVGSDSMRKDLGIMMQMVMLWRPYGEALLLLLAKALRIASSTSNTLVSRIIMKERFQDTGAMIHHLYLQHKEVIQYHPLFLSESRRIAAAVTNLDPYASTAAILKSLLEMDKCGLYGCSQTFTLQGRRFPYCAGCGKIPYCSQACQRRAWKHPGVPHKAVCATLKKICDTVGINGNSWVNVPQKEFSRKCKEANITVDEARILVRYLEDLLGHSVLYL
ncbi:uncharacterized protein BT62DRAFT_93161 [Guyanagaster necrorhizus]|uniref:MYND-type domain-containing protein n=1 Tax=Guyanagaster necrorhizus TaxID=856835 RepID=A0A9P7VUK4_9AGAR|nr:uncharacterized protein BT62DRAFT_93161 [Guyanagaster necrorhizus MCA 3950]KAG7446903.1 hypothetical protein BT62DRAFT_93161 [Guyanagaster necrorhizus MCA 3950]